MLSDSRMMGRAGGEGGRTEEDREGRHGRERPGVLTEDWEGGEKRKSVRWRD